MVQETLRGSLEYQRKDTGHPHADATEKYWSETPDLHSSSISYKARFQSAAGQYFLKVQTEVLMQFMQPWSGETRNGALVLDVGGGHGQAVAPLSAAGHRVTLRASDPAALGEAAGMLADLSFGPLDQSPQEGPAHDVAVSLRIMAHMRDWRALIAALCGSAREAVIIDFPTPGGANALAPLLFRTKQCIEGNTRPFNTMTKAEVIAEFRRHGFEVDAIRGQFVLPMVVHRVLNRPGLTGRIESFCRWIGLDRILGTPVLMRARRI